MMSAGLARDGEKAPGAIGVASWPPVQDNREPPFPDNNPGRISEARAPAAVSRASVLPAPLSRTGMILRYANFKDLKDSTCPLIARSVGNRSIDEAPKKP